MNLKLAMMFQDGCILQREKLCTIWGEAAPYSEVTVELQGQTRMAQADEQGKWSVVLEGLAASQDEVLFVKSLRSNSVKPVKELAEEPTKYRMESKKESVIKPTDSAEKEKNNEEAEACMDLHVAIGEVWILGGQSNMEFQMRYDYDIEAELESLGDENSQVNPQPDSNNSYSGLSKETHPDIRFFAYPQVSYVGQMEDYDYPMSGKWLMLTKENLEYFGAVGYYFARHIAGTEAGEVRLSATGGNSASGETSGEKHSEEISIGLLACNWGGTPACAWMDEEHVMKHGRVWREEYEQSVRNLGVGLNDDYLIHKEWSPFYIGDEADGCESIGDGAGVSGCKGNNGENAQGSTYISDGSNAEAVRQVTEARRKYEQTYRSSDSANRGNPFKDDAVMYPTTWEQQLEMMKNAPVIDPYLQQVCDALGPFHPYRPSGLYHTMLEKVAPYTARGVLWYQGESDSCHADIYEEVFSDMIENWRQLWKDELPFFCVQIAPFDRWFECRGIGYPQVRLAQQRTADHMDGVYLACIADVGDETDIHPKRKRPVGERLALLAEKYIYGKYVEADAPRCNGVEEQGNGKFALLFSNTQGGLIVHGDVNKELKIYDKATSKQMEKEAYQITVDNDRILVTLKDAGERKGTYRIAYCMTDYYEGNLFNQAGLPVFPFEVEMEL